MTVKEFSDKFDILVDSYRRMKDFDNKEILDSIDFDEYEKSLFLTQAQRDFVIGYYTGNNTYGFSFEEKELIREALDALVYTYTTSTAVSVSPDINDGKHLYTTFAIPTDLLWIVYEEIHYGTTDCVCATGRYSEVVPATHDELHRRLRNPFRGPRLRRVLRLNSADNKVELVSDYPIGSYTLRYVKEPTPIILTDLPDDLTIEGENTAMTSVLPDITHQAILELAVKLGIQSKVVGAPTSK